MANTLSRSRGRVFFVLTLLLPVLFFLTLEGGLRLANYGPNLELFVPVEAESTTGPVHLMANPDVALRYFTRVGRYPRPGNDTFLAEKPTNGYRIFMMGGSSAAGFPYPAHVMPSRILQQRLADAFPDRQIEVVNVAMAAVNSFTLRDLADEILDYEPDAVLIYAGHNEYYGALGAASVESMGTRRGVVNAYISLLGLRTVRVIRDLVGALRSWRRTAAERAGYEASYPTLMSRMIGGSVPLGSEAYLRGVNNFRANLEDILDLMEDSGVPVVLSELVSNLRDMPPFESMPFGDFPSADVVFGEARALEALGSWDAARSAYEQARDLDTLRFRAASEFNDVIHEVAAAHGAPVVPMVADFEAASPNGLIGSSLMLEHVHPDADGYLLMADAFFRTLRREGFISADWPETPPADWYSGHWPITQLDRDLGRLRVLDLMDYWPFRPVGDPGNGFASFRPSTPEEDLAYRVARDELDFVDAHEALAEIYASSGQAERAERELAAIRAANPYGFDEPYDRDPADAR
jgi:lysophospholipase L1-like esterase